jgi:hypothetical protein
MGRTYWEGLGEDQGEERVSDKWWITNLGPGNPFGPQIGHKCDKERTPGYLIETIYHKGRINKVVCSNCNEEPSEEFLIGLRLLVMGSR